MVLVRLFTQGRWRWALLTGLVVVAVVGAGFTLPGAAPANPDVRSQPPPQAFKSGGERSEIILREIAATLQRVDGRLKRIEEAVLTAAKKEQNLRPGNSDTR